MQDAMSSRPKERPQISYGIFELLPNALQSVSDVLLPVEPGSLTNIWLAHSRQLGVMIPVGDTSGTGFQDLDFGAQFPHYSEWY
jgi:hypothetical protein